jgi:hypothetical protein
MSKLLREFSHTKFLLSEARKQLEHYRQMERHFRHDLELPPHMERFKRIKFVNTAEAHAKADAKMRFWVGTVRSYEAELEQLEKTVQDERERIAYESYINSQTPCGGLHQTSLFDQP